jgi:hypothetical protein
MSLKPNTFKDSDTTGWKKHLEEEGFAVIRKVLPKKDKKEIFNTFKKEWLKVTGEHFSWGKKKTWIKQNCPINFSQGMAVYFGLSQSDFMWSLRTHPQIYSLFQSLYETDELVASMDAFSVFLSPDQKSNSWLHLDRNPNNELDSYQGAYNFLPVGKKDAGFVIVPRSHKEYKCEVSHTRDSIMVDQDEFSPKAKKLIIPENCFVIWNSNLIHANQHMTHKKVKSLNRLTAYITYFPKSLRNKEAEDLRIQSYYQGRANCHWAVRYNSRGEPSTYQSNKFNWIKVTFDEKGSIPESRRKFI